MKCKSGKSYIRNSMATSHHPFAFVVIKSTYTSILFRKRTAAIQKWERNKSPVWALGLSKLLHHENIPVLLWPVMAASLCTLSLTLNPHQLKLLLSSFLQGYFHSTSNSWLNVLLTKFTSLLLHTTLIELELHSQIQKILILMYFKSTFFFQHTLKIRIQEFFTVRTL